MEIRNVKERPALVVKAVTPMKDISRTLGEAYGAVMAYLGSKGTNPSGAPFVVYRNMDMDALEIEAGFPVAARMSGDGTVQPGSLPAGMEAVAIHTGPYETLASAYDALTAFVKEKGFAPEAWMYESYLNSPEDTKPENLMTEIVFPLKG